MQQGSDTWIPPSTAKTITFPFDKKSDTFSSDFTEPYLANYQISHQEINQFISQIETEYKLRKQSEKKNDREVKYLVLISLSSVSLSSLIFSFLLQDYDESYYFINPEGFIAGLFLPWMLLLPDSDAKRYSFADMRWKCQEIVDEHNKILKSRGLKWNIPSKFPDWIELTNDLERPNNYLEVVEQYPTKIPQTTEATIIFPAQRFIMPQRYREQPEDRILSPDFYSPEMTDGRISKGEIQGFLSEVTANFRKTPESVSDRSTSGKVVHPSYYFLSLIILIGFLRIKFPDLINSHKTVFSFFIIFVSFQVYMLVRSNKLRQERESQGHARCQKLADRENEALRSKGLRWNVPEKFPLWIELCKDYKNQSLGDQSTDQTEQPEFERKPQKLKLA